MKKIYVWFVLSAIWGLAAIFNIYDKRGVLIIGYDIFASVIFSFLGISQYFCDRKGETGKKIMNRIAKVIIVILALTFVFITWLTLR